MAGILPRNLPAGVPAADSALIFDNGFAVRKATPTQIVTPTIEPLVFDRLGSAEEGATLVEYKRTALTAAQARTLAQKSDDRFDFRDIAGADLSGNNDNASEMTAALIESAATGAPLWMPRGRPTLGSTVNFPLGAIIDGTQQDGQHDGLEVSAVTFGHSGVGFEFLSPGSTRTIRNMTFWRNQPTPGPGWEPNDDDFDLKFVGCQDVFLEGLHFPRSTRAIEITGDTVASIPSGRIYMNRITGRPYVTGIKAEHVLDCIYLDEMHFWTYVNNNSFVNDFVLANGTVFEFGRVDNAKFGRIFGFGYKRGFHITQTPSAGGNLPGGTTNKLYVDSAGMDYCTQALLVDATANNATAVFGKFYATGNFPTLSTQPLLEDLGISTCLHFSHLSVEGARRSAVRSRGPGSQMSIGSWYVNRWDTDGVQAPAMDGGPNSFVSVERREYQVLFPEGAKVYNNEGRMEVNEWIDYAPTISTTAGSITSYTVNSAKYRQSRNTVEVMATVTITNNGSGAGSVRMTLPYGNPLVDSVGYGRELVIAGQALGVSIVSGTNFASIVDDDNLYPATNGSRLSVSVRYFV